MIKAYSDRKVSTLSEYVFIFFSPIIREKSLMYDSEIMCRQKVNTPWSIYRDFTVPILISFDFNQKIQIEICTSIS